MGNYSDGNNSEYKFDDDQIEFDIDGLSEDELSDDDDEQYEDENSDYVEEQEDDGGLDDFDIEDTEEVVSQEDDISEETASDYLDGAIADNIDLHEDESEPVREMGSDFINGSNDIVVQYTDDKEDGFAIKYIDIGNIVVTNRIRKMESADALVQSIKSTGLLVPLVVAKLETNDLYVLLDGYRRIQACARAGKKKVPCIINTKVSTPEIPILEAMYNHQKRYSIKEQIDYINYLEKEKGIMNPAMIEYLLQMNNGDYTKLKDILNDNDDDIVGKLYDGVYDIATAFKKLEARRKKESREEKENKLAEGVYSDEEASGVEQIQGSGEEADDVPLTDEQIQSLAVNMESFEEDANDIDLTETVAEDDKLEGFEDHKQDVGEREKLNPEIRKAALIRDRGVCQCCKLGGPQMVNNLDAHHVVPVFLGGVDNVDNTIMLCLNCHRSVHLYATKDLAIDKALYKDSFEELDEESKLLYQNEQIFENIKLTYKKIVYLGGRIRTGMVQKGINREQYKKEHSNHDVGRRMPGKNGVQTTA